MSGLEDLDLRRKQDADSTPNVGTAFLLLSHAGYLGVSLASLAFSAFVNNVGMNHPEKRAGNENLALGAGALSASLAIWTLYAVTTTWISNTKVKNAVFGHAGFATIMLITLFVVVLSLWWIYTIS